MSAIVRAVKATYNFFAGDAVILAAVALAFIATWFLLHVVQAPMALAGLLNVAMITAGLAATLGREIAGRPRRGWTPSGWSDLGDVDLDTGVPAAGTVGQADGRVASFPDGNNAAGLISGIGVPTGLPFKSQAQRQRTDRQNADTSTDRARAGSE